MAAPGRSPPNLSWWDIDYFDVSYLRKSRCRKNALAPLGLQEARNLSPVGEVRPCSRRQRDPHHQRRGSREEEVHITDLVTFMYILSLAKFCLGFLTNGNSQIEVICDGLFVSLFSLPIPHRLLCLCLKK